MELPASGFRLDLERWPPSFTPLLFDVDFGSTDEEIMLFLGGRKAGDPIPANVITEVNPFSLEPWDSPEGMWYLYNSSNFQSCTEGRNIEVTRIGYWKPMDDIIIFRDNDTAGIKTTLEFYVGSQPFGNRTGWMMHEYHSDQKACHGSNFSQDCRSMCKVFLQNDQSSNFCDFKLPDEEQRNPFSSYDDAEHIESMLMRFFEDEGSGSSIDAPNISQPFTGNKQVLVSSSASGPHAFLELNDLYDPYSSPSTSDEYFNSEELLRYLQSASSQNMREEHNDYKLCENFVITSSESSCSEKSVVASEHCRLELI